MELRSTRFLLISAYREQYSSSRHSLGLHTCIINACEYTIPQAIQRSGHLQLWFRQALRGVVSQIPALRVGIKDDLTKQPMFVAVPTVTLSKHITWRQQTSQGAAPAAQDVLQNLEVEHANRFSNIDEQAPWRVIYIENANGNTTSAKTFHVLFAVHHALADGVSTTLFHQTLLEALNRRLADIKDSKKDVDILSFSDGPELPVPLEEKLGLYISWPFFLKTIWNEIAPKWLSFSKVHQPWAGKPYTTTPNKTCIRLVFVSSDSLAWILQACRANETTLTPLIHAVVLHALVKNIQDDNALAFTAQTSINLRPFIEDFAEGKITSQGESFGVHYTSETHQIDQSAIKIMREAQSANSEIDIIQIVARRITAELNARRQLIPNDDGVGLLPYISDYHSRWKGMYGRPRDTTWEVSNIGSMPGQPQSNGEGEGCAIVQSIFTQPGHVTGPAFSVNVSGVQSHGISVTLCWQDEVVDTELMDAVSKDVESILHTISDLQPDGGPGNKGSPDQ